MAPRTVYANLADGLQQFTLWDQSLADMGSLGVTPCTAAGTNAIVLTPISTVFSPNVAIPQALQAFSFVATASSSGAITIQVGTTAALKLYRMDGVTQASTGDIVNTVLYLIGYNAALNGAVGGFQILAPISNEINPIISGATISNSTITTSTYNGNTWTAGTGILTIAAGKTETFNNTIIFAAGADGTTQTFPSTSGTVVTSVTGASGDLTGTYPGPTIAANAVTNAKMATMAAFTFKANNTSGVATPTDITIDGLTLKASPVAADEVIIWDVAGSALKKAVLTGLGSAGGTVLSIAGNAGAFTLSNGIKNATNDIQADPVFHRSYLAGLTLSTAGASATFGIAIGLAVDSTNAGFMSLASAYTKTTSAWAVGTATGGLDTGAIANSTYYHVYLIKRPDTGVVDIAISLSASAPTTGGNIPAAYTLFRRIGSMVTNGSAQWTKFIQDGDTFTFDVPVVNVNVTNPGTAAVTRALSTPLGIRVEAILSVFATGAAQTDLPGSVLISDLSITDTAPVSSAAFTTAVFTSTAVAALQQGVPARVFTNTSSQVRSRIQISAVGTNLIIITNGWVDHRGRDA